MPPRVRRPAAAKAKVAPERGARAPRRRPSRAEEDRPVEPVETVEEKWRRGECIEADKVPLGLLEEGRTIVIQGGYWGGECPTCGSVEGLRILPDRVAEVKIRVEGTSNESLLRWSTGNKGVPARVHLCGTTCPNKVDADGLIHAVSVRLKNVGGDEDWTENLKETEDELRRLREAEAEAAAGRERAEEREKEKAAEKKKKKEKKSRSSESSDSGKKKKKKKRKRKAGDRSSAQKSLESCFKDTGLDPNPRTRRRIRKRLRRKLKKKKSSSTTESSSSIREDKEEKKDEDSWRSGESFDIFEDSHKVRMIAQRAPGVLAAATVKEMQRQMLSAKGAIEEHDTAPVPPVALAYFRQHLDKKVTGGVARECLSLCWALDQLLAGKLAACADVIGQRIKSLELTADGGSWQVAQRVEVCPPERGQLSSRQETQAAARENREDQKTRLLSKGGKDKGKGESYSNSWKGSQKGGQKDQGKGKGKKSDKEEGKK